MSPGFISYKKGTRVAKTRLVILAVCAVAGIPFLIPVGLKNIEIAQRVSKAPRQTVTVTNAWLKPISSKHSQHWVSFAEPVATPQQVLLTKEEWSRAGVGDRVTIAVLPDGTPHSLQSGANPAFEQGVVVMEVVVFIAAVGYLLFLLSRLRANR